MQENPMESKTENLKQGESILAESKSKEKTGIKQGILFGLVPHLGCIGFIAASVLGATFAVELFKPLLLNPWFFYILIAISIGFATIASAFYLRRNGILSIAGIARKKQYLATMYGSTIAVNLLLFLVIFPMMANFGSASMAALPAAGAGGNTVSQLRLQVEIPCSGHAPLISSELRKLPGVTAVAFQFPNLFDVTFDSAKTTKQQLLSIEVFETYKASVVSETDSESSGRIQLDGTYPESNNSSGAGLSEAIVQKKSPACSADPQSGSCCGTASCGCGSE